MKASVKLEIKSCISLVSQEQVLKSLHEVCFVVKGGFICRVSGVRSHMRQENQ